MVASAASPVQADVVLHFLHASIQRGEVYWRNCQDGAVLFCIAQVVDDAVQRRFQLWVVVRKVVPACKRQCRCFRQSHRHGAGCRGRRYAGHTVALSSSRQNRQAAPPVRQSPNRRGYFQRMHCAASRWLYPSFSYICISTSKAYTKIWPLPMQGSMFLLILIQ